MDSGLWCLCARISWRKGDIGWTGGRIAKEVYAHVESRYVLRAAKSKSEEIWGRQMHRHRSVELGPLNKTKTFPLNSQNKIGTFHWTVNNARKGSTTLSFLDLFCNLNNGLVFYSFLPFFSPSKNMCFNWCRQAWRSCTSPPPSGMRWRRAVHPSGFLISDPTIDRRKKQESTSLRLWDMKVWAPSFFWGGFLVLFVNKYTTSSAGGSNRERIFDVELEDK